MTAVQASGKNYFGTYAIPVAVREVPAAGHPQHPHDLTMTMHFHDFSELVIITGGQGEHIINGINYPVGSGDVFLIQGYSEHCFKRRDQVSHVNVMYDTSRLPLSMDWLRKIPGYNVVFNLEPNWRSERNFKHRLHLTPAQLGKVETIVRQMKDELEKQEDGYEAAVYSLLLELIVFISRQYARKSQDETAALVRLGKVISALENDSSRAWTLTEIARLAGMSASNLLLLFKAATGVSPIDYLIKTRLRHAAEELKNTAKSISEIAGDHGFNDSNYFSKMFKSVNGVSPRNFRKNMRS